MNEFAFVFLQDRPDQKTDSLLQTIERGSETEGQAALDSLIGRAQQSGDPDDLNAVGLGFHSAGLNDRATQVFETLVQNYPDRDLYRANLAAAYSQTGQVELCRFQLRQLAEHGSTEAFREFGKKQLSGYENFLGLSGEDQKLRDLQIKSLRRKIESPDRRAEDFLTLARLFLKRTQVAADENWLIEATRILEAGREAFPDDVQILEHLVAGYLRCDPEQHLHDTLAQLEKVAPDSFVFDVFNSLDEEDAKQFEQNNYERASALMQQVFESQDPVVREAALKDLASIVATYPQNGNYRLQYAFALMGTGQYDLSLQQARILANTPHNTHSYHFNLGQIFWSSGDEVQGRYHLNLALEYAQTEEERQDVYERIADLERPRT